MPLLAYLWYTIGVTVTSLLLWQLEISRKTQVAKENYGGMNLSHEGSG